MGSGQRIGGQKSFAQLLPQLFLFPLLIVAVGVMGYYFFRASTEDTRSVEELLSDIESGGSHARKQDMYALAVKVRDMTSKTGAPEYFSDEITRKLLSLLERSKDDSTVQQYLIAALGRAGNPEMTVPLLTGIATGADRSLEERIYAIQGLSLSRSPSAVETLKKVLDENGGSETWDLRWVALAGLANLGDPVAVPYLRRSVGDPRREVSWSSACWLANFFGDSGGIEVLRNLTDWEFLDRERGDHGRPLTVDEKEQYMVMALEGLWRLEKGDSRELLTEKSRESRSARVKRAAFELLARAPEAAKDP